MQLSKFKSTALIFFLFILSSASFSTLSAQDDDVEFIRKGRALIETGYRSLTNIGAGGKYYIAGKVPIEFGAGTLSAGGSSEFLGNVSVGYAIPLAKNIALEPSLGVLVADGGTLTKLAINFSMFL